MALDEFVRCQIRNKLEEYTEIDKRYKSHRNMGLCDVKNGKVGRRQGEEVR
jgi:hypothetical protein